ncbi:hypothetical protein BN135_3945 [Cronobacter muytjensii 530]
MKKIFIHSCNWNRYSHRKNNKSQKIRKCITAQQNSHESD